LKARALRYLAMREHSRLELRRKLLPHAAAACAPQTVAAGTGSMVDDSSFDRVEEVEVHPQPDPEATAACLDKLLDWLESHDLLSDRRFIESRLRVRGERYGNVRIRQELSRQGVSLAPEDEAHLRDTEVERARVAWSRKFDAPASTPQEHARQVRFLMGRGFSGETVQRVLRRPRATDEDLE